MERLHPVLAAELRQRPMGGQQGGAWISDFGRRWTIFTRWQSAGCGQGKGVTEDKERRAFGEDTVLGQGETEAEEDLGWV